MDTNVIRIQLPPPDEAQSRARDEAARLWNRMVKLHRRFRQKQWPWPSCRDFERHFKGRFNLHSQTAQALIQRFFANIETTRTNRQQGLQARYPWRLKRYFTCPWKGQCIRRKGDRITLPMGRGRKPLRVRLPELPPGKIVQAELGFRELRLTLRRPQTSYARHGMVE